MFRIHVRHRTIRKAKAHAEAIEHDKILRLQQAERELHFLQLRALRAITILDDRQRRNHWRESIEEMIQGAH